MFDNGMNLELLSKNIIQIADLFLLSTIEVGAF